VVRNIANFVSIVMHPLLMPTIVFFVIFNFAPSLIRPISDSMVNILLLGIFITTFLLPLLSIGILRYSNTITDLEMQDRNERVIPFIFITIFYGITTYMLLPKLRLNEVIMLVMMGITGIVFLVTVITFLWKISAHSAGISGAVGFIMALNFRFPQASLLYPLLTLVLLSGMVMSARLYLDSHTPKEILGGCLLGFLTSFLLIFIYFA
jgi:membrane-associated phospholipid phosphatase